jgi:hypothetical protein
MEANSKMKKLSVLYLAIIMIILSTAIGCSAPMPAPTPAPAPTQTPKTTKVTPVPGGKGIMGASGSFPAMTLEELIKHSDTIVIGKVADILPAKKGKDPRGIIPEIIYQDVIVQAERYLYGEPESEFVAIRVLGGKVGDTYFISDVDPEFTVGEEVLLFLYHPQTRFIQNVPEGIDSRSIYKVTASIPGKYEFRDGIATSYKGETTDISEVEQKIASIHGGE